MTGGEIPSQRLTSYNFGLATVVGFLMARLTQFTASYFINPTAMDWGPRYGFIWCPSAIIAAVWVYFVLPEVKGRSLEEIDEMVSSLFSFNSKLLKKRVDCSAVRSEAVGKDLAEVCMCWTDWSC
jgi:hypothetical protein